MNHSIQLLITISLVTINAPCAAMEINHVTKPSILAKFTTASDRRHEAFLTNDNIFIRSQEEYLIVDIKTQKIIKTLKNIPHRGSINIHPSHKNFIIFNDNSIKIYNTETKEQIQEHIAGNKIVSATFNPLKNETIYILTQSETPNRYQLTEYNYRNNCDKKVFFSLSTKISFHPTLQKACYISSKTISTTVSWDNDYTPISLKQERLGIYPSINPLYSPDGSTIIINSPEIVFTLNSETLNINKYVEADENEGFRNVQIHPNNLFLAILYQIYRENTLQVKFWDIEELPDASKHTFKQPTPITETERMEYRNDFNFHYHLSFSPDGTKFMIAFSNECMIFSVPFELIYQPHTKEKATYAYWILKNYQPAKHETLPQDITQLLMHTLLETCKY